MLARRTREQVQTLLTPENAPEQAAPLLPTMIEVPQWLARLEPRLSALETKASSPFEAAPKQHSRAQADAETIAEQP